MTGIRSAMPSHRMRVAPSARAEEPVVISGLSYDARRHSLVFDITGPVTISTRSMKSPARLVVDMPSARLRFNKRELAVNDAFVSAAREPDGASSKGAARFRCRWFDELRPVLTDTEGGFVSDPHPCGQSQKSVSTQSGHRDFGGRRASWRHWTFRCEKRSDVLVEQYVVTSSPGYVLYSDQATPEIVAAMTTIAGKTRLAT